MTNRLLVVDTNGVLAFIGGSHAARSNLEIAVKALETGIVSDEVRALPNLLAERYTRAAAQFHTRRKANVSGMR